LTFQTYGRTRLPAAGEDRSPITINFDVNFPLKYST